MGNTRTNGIAKRAYCSKSLVSLLFSTSNASLWLLRLATTMTTIQSTWAFLFFRQVQRHKCVYAYMYPRQRKKKVTTSKWTGKKCTQKYTERKTREKTDQAITVRRKVHSRCRIVSNALNKLFGVINRILKKIIKNECSDFLNALTLSHTCAIVLS